MKLGAEVSGLKYQISELTTKIATLVERIPAAKTDKGGTEDGANDGDTEKSTQTADHTTQESTQPADQQPAEQVDCTAEGSKPNNTQGTTTPAPEPQQPGKTPKRNWANVVKSGRKALPKELQTRMADSIKSLSFAGFQSRRTGLRAGNVIQPKPVAVNFSNIPRGPISALKKELLKCLPKWAILGFSFIGSAMTEILCHSSVVDRLVATMRFFGISICRSMIQRNWQLKKLRRRRSGHTQLPATAGGSNWVTKHRLPPVRSGIKRRPNSC